MTIDLRAVLFAGLLIAAAAVVFAVSQGGGSSDNAPAGERADRAAMDTSDRRRFPWVLMTPVRLSPHRWTEVLDEEGFPRRFPSKDICHAAGRAYKAKTGRRFWCRYDGPPGD